jgi:hypothetical protein
VISDFWEATECTEVRDSEEWASSRSLYCSSKGTEFGRCLLLVSRQVAEMSEWDKPFLTLQNSSHC